MKQIIRRVIFLQGLCIVFLSGSTAWAVPKPKKETHWTENTNIGVKAGFGLSFFNILSSIINDQYKSAGMTCKSNINTTPGLTLGYDLPYFHRLKVGPEFGLSCSFTNTMKLSIQQQDKLHASIELRKRYLYIPIGIKIRAFKIGYEWPILLSSVLKGNIRYKASNSSSFKEDSFERNSKKLPGMGKLPGSFYMGGVLNLPRGFYMDIQIKISSIIFKGSEIQAQIESELQEIEDKMQAASGLESMVDKIHLLTRFMPPSSIIELNIGVNVLKLFRR